MQMMSARRGDALAFTGVPGMRSDFLARQDGELNQWAAHVAAKLAVEAPAFGVPEAMAEDFIAKQQAFAAALSLAQAATTRTAPVVREKNDSRRSLEIAARQVAAMVRATPSVTSGQRIELGIRVKKEGLTRVAKPSTPPAVRITSSRGNTIDIQLIDIESGRCSKPNGGIAGAMLYTFVGPQWPADKDLWQCRGNITRCRASVRFAASTPPGSRVWVMAAWYNTRGEHGATSQPVSINIAGGEVMLNGIALAA
jgi:hypothetical protein